MAAQGLHVFSFAQLGTTILAAADWGGIRRSEDGGASWTEPNAGLPDQPVFESVFAVVAHGSMLFAGTTGSGVYRSEDGGDSWTEVNTGLPTLKTVVSLGTSGTMLLAGTQGQGVFRSGDDGDTWTATNIGVESAHVPAITAVGATLFAATLWPTGNGVFRSLDDGDSWTPVNSGLENPDVRCFATDGAALFTGTNWGVYRTEDGGDSWTQVPGSLSLDVVYSLALSGSTLYAATESRGAFRSDDGATWAPINHGLRASDVRSLATSGATVYAGTRDGVWRSDDAGHSWSRTAARRWPTTALAASGTTIIAGQWGGVHRSMDGGATWRLHEIPDLEALVHALAVTGATVYAGTQGAGVFRSDDGGETWTAPSNELSSMDVRALLLFGPAVYAGTWGAGVFRSDDSGATWTPANIGIENARISAVIGHGAALFAGTAGDGVVRSLDGGGTWSQVNDGTMHTYINSFVTNGSALYAGTDWGLFRTDSAGDAWTQVSDGRSHIRYRSPVRAGATLYTGTHGSGVFRAQLLSLPRPDRVAYTSFASTEGLALVGDAQQHESRLRLSSSDASQTGAAWHYAKQQVADGFETRYQFQLSEFLDGGPEGFAFVIQNSDAQAVGEGWAGIGYERIPNSLAVEFDTFMHEDASDPFGDPNDNHISVQSLGSAPNTVREGGQLGVTAAIPDMSDGALHDARVLYTPGSLQVFLDDLVTPVLTVAVDLSTLLQLDDGAAWVGLTAATGDAWENHDILSWFFTPAGGPGGPGAGVAVSLTTPTRVAADGSFVASVRVEDELTDLDAMSIKLSVSPPSGVVEYDGVELGGTLLEGASVTPNLEDAASPILVFNLPGVDGVSGSGELARVRFNVTGANEAEATIGLTSVALSRVDAQVIEAHVASGELTVTVGTVPGDATGDGEVTVVDITKIERIVVGLDAAPVGSSPDANEDGSTDILDITSTERLVAGLPAVTPAAPQAAVMPSVSVETTFHSDREVTLSVDTRESVSGIDTAYFSLVYSPVDYEVLGLDAVGLPANASHLTNATPGRVTHVVNVPGLVGASVSDALAEIRLRRLNGDASTPLSLDIHLGDVSARSVFHRTLDIPLMWRPDATAALPNFPNPFNPETWIPFQLSEVAEVQIAIYDATGEEIRLLDLGSLPAGYYRSRGSAAYWDGRNAMGEAASSGVYFYRIQAGGYSAARKMMVLK
ncbi:hypothetical protein CMK11_12730 [Candidatus Poribacteria bacterium]|nr:hypothetical protein [Candidatus Poribacteria bacterium]